MKICVCIPTFNRSAELKLCLESLLKNSISSEDIYVFDNHSTEFHRNNIIKLQEYFKFNLTFNCKNLGLSGNLKKCLSIPGYDYMIIFEDHDIASENFIERLAYHAKNSPKAALIVPERFHINQQGKLIDVSRARYVGEINGSEFIKSELRNFTFCFPMCAMLRVECISAYPITDYKWYGDIYVWLSMALNGPVFFTNEHIYYSRTREENHPLNINYMESIKEITDIHYAFIRSSGVTFTYLDKILFSLSKLKKILVMESRLSLNERKHNIVYHVVSKVVRKVMELSKWKF